MTSSAHVIPSDPWMYPLSPPTVPPLKMLRKLIVVSPSYTNGGGSTRRDGARELKNRHSVDFSTPLVYPSHQQSPTRTGVSMNPSPPLSRREREVMDIIHEVGRATATQVRDAMETPPSNAAVRSDVAHSGREGPPRIRSRRPPLRVPPPPFHSKKCGVRHYAMYSARFYGGSIEGAMAALLELEDRELSVAESERLKAMIDAGCGRGSMMTSFFDLNSVSITELILRATALLVVPVILGVALKRTAANVRHTLWTTTFALLIALPVLVGGGIAVAVPMIPSPRVLARRRSGDFARPVTELVRSGGGPGTCPHSQRRIQSRPHQRRLHR